MKLSNTINEIYSYKKVDQYLSTLHLTNNNFKIPEQNFESLPHISQVNKRDINCFYIETKKKNKNNSKIILWANDPAEVKKINFNRQIDEIYIFNPHCKVDMDNEAKKIQFIPEIHLKKLDFSTFNFLALPESFNQNLNNALINAIYSMGATPFFHFSAKHNTDWQIETKIELSFNHSLNVLRRIK